MSTTGPTRAASEEPLIRRSECDGIKAALERVFGSCIGRLFCRPKTEKQRLQEWVLIEIVDRQPTAPRRIPDFTYNNSNGAWEN